MASATFFLASCGMTRIVTVSPGYSSTNTYSTTVTVPSTHTVTTVTNVGSYLNDISLHLDLQAVVAAFGQASTVAEFEYAINNSSYMISNLDLNRDGYVDYLRVMEVIQGYNHIFVIQAVLAPNVFQDVATIVAEIPSRSRYHVQIIGSPYIFGPNYIIQPYYIYNPMIFNHLCRPSYRPWRSPWYWSHYPSCYRRPSCIHVSHYHAYIDTYMRNHRYCREFRYVPNCHYPDYDRYSRPVQRNDYGVKYPERSFTVRNANSPSRPQSAGSNFNAQDIRRAVSASESRTTSTSGTSRSSEVSGSRTATSGSQQTSTTRQPASSSSSQTTSGSRTTSGSSRTAASSGQTTTSTRVGSNGSSDTRIKTTTSAGSETTSRRTSGSSASSSSSSSSSRSAAASSSSSSSRSAAGSSSSSSSRSAAGSSRSSSSSSSSSSSRSSGSSSSSSSSSGSRRSR